MPYLAAALLMLLIALAVVHVVVGASVLTSPEDHGIARDGDRILPAVLVIATGLCLFVLAADRIAVFTFA